MTIAEIKKLLDNEKLLIGTNEVLKSLRTGKIQKVMLSSNCKAETIDDLKHYKELSDFEIETLEVPNDELGLVCKKPFSVSVIGILK
jgi:large subunit ribosomal protein L30e